MKLTRKLAMLKNNTDKPLLKDFLRNQLIPFYWFSKYTYNKSSKYVEIEKTAKLTRLICALSVFIILFFDLADNIISIIILLIIAIILEVIHWLYAKFDKLESNN